MARIYLFRKTSSTPPLQRGHLHLARFQTVIDSEANRYPRRVGWDAMACQTLGEVLDLPHKGPCVVRTLYLSQKKGNVMGMFAHPCGSPRCRECVIPYLQDHIAPAWSYWGGTASVARLSGGSHTERDLDALGVRMRAPATPGAVRFLMDPQLVWAPEMKGGEQLTGDELNTALREAVRAVRLPPEEEKAKTSQTGHSRIVPSYVTQEAILEAMQEVGGKLSRKGPLRVTEPGITEAEYELTWALLSRGSG